MRFTTFLLSLSPLLGLGVVLWVAAGAGVSLRGITGLVPLSVHVVLLGAWGLSLAGRGTRIALLARGLGAPLSLGSAMGIQLTGEGAAAATPSRSGSDPARLLYLKRSGVDFATGMAVLIGEIVAEGVILLGIIGLFLAFMPGARIPALGALPYALGALAMPFAAVLLVRLPARRTPPRLTRALGLTEGRWRGVRAGVRRFSLKARSLSRLDRKTIIGVLLVSLVHVLARLAILPVLALGTVPSAPLAPLIAWPLLLLYTGSLLPPPGGGGAVEITFAAGLSGTLGGEVLAGLLLWWRLYTFYLGAAMGGILILLILGRVGISAMGAGRKTSTPAGAPVTPLSR